MRSLPTRIFAVREMYVATEHSRAGTFKTIGVPGEAFRRRRVVSIVPRRRWANTPSEILGAPTT